MWGAIKGPSSLQKQGRKEAYVCGCAVRGHHCPVSVPSVAGASRKTVCGLCCSAFCVVYPVSSTQPRSLSVSAALGEAYFLFRRVCLHQQRQ
jgi:hypothetical protein